MPLPSVRNNDTVVIWNPKSGTADQARELRSILDRRERFRVIEPAEGEDIVSLVASAVADGAGLVVAAGGDGTVNAVANGLVSVGGSVPMALLPIGTGNDFCRTLGVPDDPVEAVDLLSTGRFHQVDVVRIDYQEGTCHYVNMATGGFSGEVMEQVTDDMKRRWGKFAYVRGAVEAIAELGPYDVEISLDDGPVERFNLFNFVLANGRTSAHGLTIAPQADPTDGLLEVLLVLDVALMDLAALASGVIAGEGLTGDRVIRRRSSKVRLRCPAEPMPIAADGELITEGEATFTIMPGALPVITGPGFLQKSVQ